MSRSNSTTALATEQRDSRAPCLLVDCPEVPRSQRVPHTTFPRYDSSVSRTPLVSVSFNFLPVTQRDDHLAVIAFRETKGVTSTFYLRSFADVKGCFLSCMPLGFLFSTAGMMSHVVFHTNFSRHRCDVEAPLRDGLTRPLHIACRKGYEKAVTLLLDSKADLAKPGLDGLSPLHVAAKEGKAAVVEVRVRNSFPAAVCPPDTIEGEVRKQEEEEGVGYRGFSHLWCQIARRAE